jgi:translation initiation factor IF-2
VVAADDSVMPQTIESINHAKAAGVPIIVAINKIDKPTPIRRRCAPSCCSTRSSSNRWAVKCSTSRSRPRTGTNLDKLLEAILLQAEILDLKANPDRTAEGVVIEAKLDGPRSVATVLVQTGTLKPGDIIVAGDQWGRVRALVNDAASRSRKPARHAGRGARPSRARRRPATASPWSRTRPRPRDHRIPPAPRPREGRGPPCRFSAARSSR